MITFKQYFLTVESLLSRTSDGTSIPSKDLLLNNNIKDLPEEVPYGFWVDRSGNFVAVYMTGSKNNGGHAGVAKSIIEASIKYKDEHGGMTPEEEDSLFDALKTFKGVYGVLFSSGFMHVVLAGNTFYYKVDDTNHLKPQRVTPGQIKFLNALEDAYNKSTEYTSEIF